MAEWFRKQDVNICYLQETHPLDLGTQRLKVKWMEKDIPCKQ